MRKLPRFSWDLSLKPPRLDHGRSRRSVWGFDTEYDSKTGELLTVQLWRPEKQIYYEVRKNEQITYEFLRKLTQPYRSPFLVAFFSVADISKLSDWWNAKLTDTGLGMLMAESGDITIFDVGTFWSSDRSLNLAKLGELVGVPKLQFDTTQVSRKSLKDPLFKPYAMMDAEICYKAYSDFIRETIWKLFGVDPLHYRSSPAISATIFRRTLESAITPPPKLIRSMALRSYWGGRSEVYRVGKIVDNIVEVDANSEYPRACIALGDLPDGEDWKVGGNYQDYKDGFVNVLFAYPENFQGFLALPVYWDKRLYWPRSGESYCTISEIRAARKACPTLNLKIRSVAGYKRGTRGELSAYLGDLLERKDNAKGADRYAYKLLANSVIGKLAQNRRTNKDAEHLSFCQDIGVPADFMPLQAGRGRIEVGNCYWPEAASLILGKARAVLYEAMQKIGKSKVLLCSTDSIVYIGEQAEFAIDGIPFEVENVGNNINIWREKVYVIKKGEEILKIAHHALPRRAMVQDGKTIIPDNAETISVPYKEFVKISRAARGAKFGSVIHRQKTVGLTPSKWKVG